MTNSISTASAYYARTSTEEQKEKETIQSQISALETEIRKSGEALAAKYIDDGHSGAVLDRPALDQLRVDASGKLFTKLYIYSPDRLARDLMLQLLIVKELKKHGIEIVFLSQKFSDSPSDQLLFQMLGAISQFERAQILERTRRGKIHKARCGIWIGGVAKFGYKYTPKTDTVPSQYEIDPEEIKAVRQLFQIFNLPSVFGMRTLAKELYSRGIKNRSGNTKWAKSSLSKILNDTTYIGTAYYNKLMSCDSVNVNGQRHYTNKKSRRLRPKDEWIPIAVPALITKEEFESAQLKLQKNRELSDRNAKYNYLVRGLIFCRCGKRMYGYPCHEVPRYKCSDKHSKYPLPKTCDNGSVDTVTLDRTVWTTFLEVLERPEVVAQKIQNMYGDKQNRKADIENQVAEIDRDLSNLTEQEERLLEAYTVKVIDLSRLKTQSNGLAAKKRHLMQSRMRLEAESREFIPQLTQTEIRNYFFDIKEKALAAKFELKQQILRLFLHKVVLDNRKALLAAYLPCPVPTKFMQSGLHERNKAYEFQVQIDLDHPDAFSLDQSLITAKPP